MQSYGLKEMTVSIFFNIPEGAVNFPPCNIFHMTKNWEYGVFIGGDMLTSRTASKIQGTYTVKGKATMIVISIRNLLTPVEQILSLRKVLES